MSDTKIKITLPGEVSSAALVEQTAAGWFMGAANAEVLASELDPVAAEFVASGDAFWDDEDYRRFRPYSVVGGPDGARVLVVPVRGSLIPDFPYQAGVYATGYEYITEAVRRGAADSSVSAILLDVNSPGGVVRGCAECALAIAEATRAKPVIAYAADMAASAAYWLASQATQIHVSNTGEVGSIGVITGHFDYSEDLKSWGVKFTPIFAGERKADGHPYLPLGDEAKAGIQKRLNAIYAEFISAVARGRKIDGNDVRATQAAMFPSREAVRNGLADAVSTRREVMSVAFGAKSKPQAGSAGNDKEAVMFEKTNQAETPATQTQAAAPAATPAPEANAVQAAVSAAMSRVQEILGSAEAKGRESQANVFAFKTDLPAAQVRELLAAAPVAAATAPQPSAFERAMADTPNPEVGAGAGSDDSDGVMANIMANFK